MLPTAQRAVGHEAMDEDEIPDTGMTAGHGTFVPGTGDVEGDVRGHFRIHTTAGHLSEETLYV